MRNQEFHRCRSNPSPLLRHIDRQVEQLGVCLRVSQGDYPDDRGRRGQGQRLPVEVALAHVRLGEDDQSDRLMTSDEPDLVRRYLHGYGGPPVPLIDGCQAEGRGNVHGVILPREAARGPADLSACAAQPSAALCPDSLWARKDCSTHHAVEVFGVTVQRLSCDGMATIVLRVRLTGGDHVDVTYEDPHGRDEAELTEQVVSTLSQDSGVLRATHGDRLVVLYGRGVSALEVSPRGAIL